MMKQLVIISVFLTTCTVFGQSKKEVNKQLTSELLMLQQKERLMKQQHDSLTAVLERDKNEIIEKGRVLREQQVREKEFSESVKSRYAKLQRLDHKLTADSIITYDQWKQMKTEAHYKQQSEMKELLNEPFVLAQVDDQLDQLNEMKLKEQNLYLLSKIQEHQTVIEQNTALIQREKNASLSLSRISTRIDSITKQSELYTSQLDRKNNDLQAQLYRLRMNYMKNGPKGFSDAYADIFADVYFEYFAPENEIPMQEQLLPEEDNQVAFRVYDAVEPPPMPEPEQQPEIYEVVEEQAMFPGGTSAFKTYMKENLKLPEAVRSGEIQGKTYVRFIITDKGMITNVKVVKGVKDCKECDEAAVELVKGMPNWIPAKNNGKTVNSYFNLPVTFMK